MSALRELEKSGVDPSGRSLLQAVLERNQPLAALLLEAGVYTEQRDARGRTPLAIASEEADSAWVCMLLNARANVNATLADHTFIPGIAARRADTTIFETLMAAGARTDGLMPDGERLLPWAIRHARRDLIEVLMKADSDPHQKDSQGNPLLHIAMEAGRRDLMESLIALGADAAATNAVGETTLHLALRRGWLDALPMLAAAGADPNAPGPDGHTLLEQAMDAGDAEKTALFLHLGADPHFRHGLGLKPSPWERAFEQQNPATLELFLHHATGAPLGGWEPWLWRTIRSRDFTKAGLLLAHGARGRTRGLAGLLPVEAAALAGQTAFVKLLLDYGCPAGHALDLAAARGDHDLVSVILACGVAPDPTRFPTRDTTLTAAIRQRHDRVARLLLQHGASARLKPPEGQSVFHLAVATACHLTVKQLLATGADPNAPFSLPVSREFLRQVRPGVMRWILKMDRNATPLMLAADSGSIHTARYLIESGAKMNVRTGFSALWPINFAARRSDVRMLRLFLGRDPYREERIIEIRLSEQLARMYDGEGREIFATRVSTGRPGFATPTGEYAITNKYREWTSTLYDASMPYFQRLSCGDFGLHQGHVPGRPASHGCIRVPAGNAARLFAMTRTGDRVRILP